ncbi:MAG: DnaA N-terminal domain-containing protein, partial [Rhodothermales bacterium]|nr:DnaA N-terminal domain-containing protein [Rhodothermales bacterium]
MTRNPEEVWSACLDTFRDVVDRQSYETWFMPISAVSLEQDGALTKLTVRLPSPFLYEWLEAHYPALIRKTVQRVLGPDG